LKELKMAIVEVKVPQLSESVAEATMLQWKKKAGEAVAADEILIEIETDKVVLEVPAPAAGVLAEIVVADGATVVAEQLIAKIDTEGKAPALQRLLPRPLRAAALQQWWPCRGCLRVAPRPDVAMPAAAKLMADNNLAAGSWPAPARTAA
jgi:2-oxoglutarate dehydrogenase E2 component (dihydrolipoamide succinyltransferase)